MHRYVKKFSGKDQMTKLQLYFSHGQNHNLKEINLSSLQTNFPLPLMNEFLQLTRSQSV